ncbi:MAG: hypothetical protein ACXVBF_00505 [Flavisolibacter sp.]
MSRNLKEQFNRTMKMFSLSVYPANSSKASPFTPLIVSVSNVIRIATDGTIRTIAGILYHLSLPLQEITWTGSDAASNTLNRKAAGQQHIYAPVGPVPFKGKLAGSQLIRFSNGRTPYTTKQVIF